MNKNKITFLNGFKLILFIFIQIELLDILFAWIVYGVPFNKFTWLVILFNLGLSFIVGFILLFFSYRVQFIIMILLFLSIGYIYFMQNIFHVIFTNLFTFSIFNDAGKATKFANFFLKNIRIVHLVYFLPLIFITIFYNYLVNHRIYPIKFKTIFKNKSKIFISKEGIFILLLSAVIINFSSNLIVNSPRLNENETGETTSEIYMFLKNGDVATSRFGLMTYTILDFTKNYMGIKPDEEEVIDLDIDQNVNYQDPIDWSNFGDSTNKDINLLDNYFRYRYIPSSNNMTGIFEGKNLILILAESLDEMIIRPDIMPNLYHLKETGYYFKNFYAPIYYRTTGDSEFMVQTSIFPDGDVVLNEEQYKDNYYQYTLPKLFEDKEYTTSAYHDYTDFFYPRTEFLTTLGYGEYWDIFKLGQQVQYWPSDKEMIIKSASNFMTEDHFFAYYVSVSGHLHYDGTNAMAAKNYSLFSDLPYDDELKYYFAAQHEFDDAIGELISQLEWYGQLDNTVIAIHSDHYPYGITDKGLIEDFSDIDRTEPYHLHNVPFIVWTPGLQPQEFEEYMSTIDIMPTLSNMFNLNIDYRFLFGKDAFDSRDNYVAFLNNSWISEKGTYSSITQKFTPYYNVQMASDDYISKINNDIIARKQLSILALENDYYKYRFLDN